MKRLVASLMAMMLVLSLAACGDSTPSSGGGSTDGEAAAPSGSGEAVADDASASLSYVAWTSEQEVQNRAVIAAFNEKYPNIDINLSYSTWDEYWNKLEASASAGELPDIITMHTNTIEMYVNNNFMVDLTDLDQIDPDFSYDNHPEDVKKLYRFNDRMWGVPKDFDCIVMVYNKELFDNAGLDYPTDDWTWDDLETAAAALTDKDAGVFGFGARNDQQGGYASFLYQNGGGILTEDGTRAAVDDPKSIEAMEWWLHMYHNYSPSQASYAESQSYILFGAGVVAMQTIGNWELGFYIDNEEIDDKWDIVALPHPANGQKATIMNGLALTVASSSKEIDAAKQYVAFFGTKEGQEAAAMGPSIPCYEGVSEVWAELNKDYFNVNAVLSQMQYGKQWVGTESKTQWNAVLETAITNIYNDGAEIAPTLTEAAVRMNEILEEEQARKA